MELMVRHHMKNYKLRFNTTAISGPGENESIKLWSKILPFLVLGTLLIYFAGVVRYYFRKLQNLDEITTVSSYMTTSGALDTPHRMTPNGVQSKTRALMEIRDSDFSFRPVTDNEDKGD